MDPSNQNANLSPKFWAECYDAETKVWNVERLQDFFNEHRKKRQIAELITSLVCYLKGSAETDDVNLPKPILDRFAVYCQDLQSSQCRKLWIFFMNSTKEFLQEDKAGNRLKVLLDMWIILMMNTQLIDHTVLPFKNLLNEIQESCLINLLNYCLENNEELSLLSSTVQLCYAWAELKFMLSYYFEINFECEEMESNQNELNGLHSYFSHWENIYHLAKSDSDCTYYFARLLLQNIQKCKKAKTSAKKLFKLGKIHPQAINSSKNVLILILKHLSVVIPHWKEKTVLNFAQQITEMYLLDTDFLSDRQVSNLLSTEQSLELRKFHTAFISVIWKDVSIVVNSPFLEKLGTFFTSDIIEGDEKLDDEDSQISQLFKVLANEFSQHIESENPTSDIDKLLKLFKFIPLPCLSPANQTRCLMGFFNLMLNFQLSSENYETCLRLTLKLLTIQKNAKNFRFVSFADLLKSFIKTDNLNIDDSTDEMLKLYEKFLRILVTSAFTSAENINDLDPLFAYLKANGKSKKWEKLVDRKKRIFFLILTTCVETSLKVWKLNTEANTESKEYATKNCHILCGIILDCAGKTKFDSSCTYFCPLLDSVVSVMETINVINIAEEMKREYRNQISTIVPLIIKLIKHQTNDLDIVSIMRFVNLVKKFNTEFLNISFKLWRNLKSAYKNAECGKGGKQNLPFIEKNLSGFIEGCQTQQLQEIVTDLTQSTLVSRIDAANYDEVVCGLKIWLAINFTTDNEDQINVLVKAVEKFLLSCPHLIRNCNMNKHKLSVLVMKLIEKFCRSKQLFKKGQLFTYCLHTYIAIINSHTRFENVTIFSQIFSGLFSILNALMVNHMAIVTKDVALVNSCLSSLMQLLMEKCDQSTVRSIDKELPVLEKCAMNFNKLIHQLTDYKGDFVRVIPYLIADYISKLENVTLIPSIKEIIRNGMYDALDICDEHSIKLLKTNLPFMNRELFKQLYTGYETHYKFSGKKFRNK